ncbi:hypothetical protein M422DRAFT_782793 [Sphaerobolus stellatus SS14]|uniref:SEC7 domain-containing protein n=1 Tax=Sphaerobolus stellatus (strain SS14) TaxID=990650 RepID=A0A0C9UZB1_SPHS4|nr:hypothetical protein M422DRAFT_782793 [Sphaerobolus stellatus SS14]
MHIVVSPKHLIEHEILSVTSAMRKNSRWATPNRLLSARDTTLARSMGLRHTGMLDTTRAHDREDIELMAGFEDLKREIREIDDSKDIPLLMVVAPFLALIRSPLSTGPITSAALMSLHTFFVSGIIHPTSVGLGPALATISNTISNCKFEASDSAGDEVVLLRIVTVIRECISGSVGPFLGDVEVCEMLETVLTVCCQMRSSEVLRRSAEFHMQAIVREIFGRLKTLDPDEEAAKLNPSNGDSIISEVKMELQTTQRSNPFAPDVVDAEPVEAAPTEEASDVQESSTAHLDISETSEGVIIPYGLPSIMELLRVLVNLLNPMDQQHTDATRITSLRILNTALEVAGKFFGNYPMLSTILFDHGCKYLFLLARSDNPTVLYLSLRVISTLFVTLRPYLKLQQELFLTFTIDRLALLPVKTSQQLASTPSKGSPAAPSQPPSSIPRLVEDAESELGTRTPPTRATVAPARGETRELMLEMLGSLASPPSFMVDLWTNYDCDPNCEDLFERLIFFLTRGVYGLQGADRIQQQSAQLLSLDLLLAFINHMTVRAQGSTDQWPDDAPQPETLLENKSQKRLMLTGAALFNEKTKIGIRFFKENRLISVDVDGQSTPRDIARFLKYCPRLDKKLLGDFLSKPDNREILDAFIETLDFTGKTIADAMRDMLQAFRLPGEAQQIERITETFAKHYFAAQPEGIKSQDAVFILAYSVILLNTDQHNPQVRKRMTLDDYRRNLRGVNGGEDFDHDYLKAVYDSICKREIVLPDEHSGQVGFEHAWKELLQRTQTSGSFVVCNASFFDRQMFSLVWKPVISTIAYAFTSYDDDYVVQRAITGFRQCATLAGIFQLPDIFDYIVQLLSRVTSLLSDTSYLSVPNYPIVEVEGREIAVSALSIKFGNDIKAQLAAVVLFTIANGNGNAIREGWAQIFEMFETLFLHSLLPPRMIQMEDFLGGVSMIPLHSIQPSQHPTARGDGGLLSALSSYLLTPYASSSSPTVPEATDSQVESSLCTIDCISACRLDELYSQIIGLDLEPFISALRALCTVSDNRTAVHTASLTAQGPEDSVLDIPLPYDPGSVFLLEMMVSLASQTPQYIEDVWPVVFDHISSLLSSATRSSMLLIERAVVGLLRLCLVVAEKPVMRDQLYLALDVVGSLPPSVLNGVAEQVVAGVILIVQRYRRMIRSQTEWALVFSLVRKTMAHPEASKHSFGLVQDLASDKPEDSVTPDSFVGLIAVLDDFALAAGASLEGQKRRDKRIPANTSQPIIERGTRAIELLAELKRFVPKFVDNGTISHTQAWKSYTMPLLISLGHHSSNSSKEIRHAAMSYIQRILLGPVVLSVDHEQAQVEEIFNRVVFPLLDELLKPETLRRDPSGMPETRLRAAALLCKVFLHFVIRLSESQSDIRVLWIQILDLLDRLMNIDKQDQLYEAAPESLKNVLLVLHASGILVPPHEPDTRDERQRSMWAATQERIDRFIPGFLSDIIASPSQGE